MAKHRKKKLLDRVRDAMRTKHYSLRTEQAYVGWVRRFILFHDKRHPKEMGAAEIEEYLTYLAVKRNVAASTQNPCTEPVEVRPSARCCSSIRTCSRKTWSILSTPSAPRSPNAYPPS